MGNKISSPLDELKNDNKKTRRFAGLIGDTSAKAGTKKEKTLLDDIQKRCRQQYPYLDQVFESVCITDMRQPDNPIVYVSDEFEKMTLYPKEEIVGRNCRFLQGKYTDKDTVKKIAQAVRESKAIEVELLNYRKDGTPFFNHFVILPLFKGKKCTHFVAVQKDITALRQSSDPRDWTSVDVALWLEDIGLPHHAPQFCEQNITGERLIELTRADLPVLGVQFRTETKLLADSIDDLRLLMGLDPHASSKRRKKKGKKNKASKATEAMDKRKNEKFPASWQERAEEATFDIDAARPRELDLWQKAPDTNVLAIKAHYKGRIELIRVPGTCSIQLLHDVVQQRFEGVRMIIRLLANDLSGGSQGGTLSEEWSDQESSLLSDSGNDKGARLVKLRNDDMLKRAFEAADSGTLDVYLRPAPAGAKHDEFDHLNCAAMRTDSEGYVVWVNEAAEALFGIGNSDVSVIDVALDDLFEPIDMERFPDTPITKNGEMAVGSISQFAWTVPVKRDVTDKNKKDAKGKAPKAYRALVVMSPVDEDEQLCLVVPLTTKASGQLAALPGSAPEPLSLFALRDAAAATTESGTVMDEKIAADSTSKSLKEKKKKGKKAAAKKEASEDEDSATESNDGANGAQAEAESSASAEEAAAPAKKVKKKTKKKKN